MKIFADGREIEVPTDGNGNVEAVDVRRANNVSNDRMMIQQKPGGENFIVPKSGKIHVDPYDRFMDAPRAVRGRKQ